MGNESGLFGTAWSIWRPRWNTERIAVLNLETTGTDPTTARIVTAAIATLDPTESVDGEAAFSVSNTRGWLVNPGCEIPAGATAVHGVTMKEASDHGVPSDVACLETAKALAGHWLDGVPVCVYNASHDLTVLDRELRRHYGLTLSVGYVLDPHVIDKQVDRYREGSRTLAATCSHYGVRRVEARNTLADAIAAGLLMHALAIKYGMLARTKLRDLHMFQIGWFRVQQAESVEYRRRNGRSVDDVNGEWPTWP
jgi:DNA polymerase III subunit epsilon